MLAKIFGILLGIIGLATTTVHSPAPPATVAPKMQSAVVKVTEKTATSTDVGNFKKVKDTSGDFSQLKSPVKVQKKKPSAKAVIPIAAAPKSAEAPRPATTTTSLNPPLTGRATEAKRFGLASPIIDWSAINQKVRQVIVNILCTSRTAGLFEPLSGSGVIIDPRGVILTNAHVAQYLLLKDYGVKNFLTCIARTGSPATPAYTLKILYISPQWLQDNYKNITDQHPTGTGENDFALLQIVGSTDPDLTLQKSFPALSTDGNEDDIKTGAPVVLAGYPAGFLGGIAIQRDLYIVSSIVNIGQRFTFRTGTVDAFSLGGSPVAQHGSSGGAVVSSQGKLLGIIVTSTDAKDTAGRDLDAISIAHINHSLAAETSLSLDSLLASNLENFSAQFEREVLPGLKKLLLDELNSKNH